VLLLVVLVVLRSLLLINMELLYDTTELMLLLRVGVLRPLTWPLHAP
jgi:hypothetical protein